MAFRIPRSRHTSSGRTLSARTIILAIETSNPSAWSHERRAAPGVALGVARPGGAGVDVLAVEPIRLDDPHYDDLVGAIARACQRAGVAPTDLARVAVSVGPGGYTAVRVAVMAAKMISLATGAGCVPVESARVVAARVRRGTGFAVCLASKGEDCHVQVFEASGEARGPAAIRTASTMMWDQVGLLVADGFLPQPFREQAAARGIGIEPPEFDPVACLELGAAGVEVAPDVVLPIYPRIPEAVRKWRELGRGVS